MWFTQVSLRNPVFATMVMLAFVVLGLFSFQRLQVDQFPSIDFPEREKVLQHQVAVATQVRSAFAMNRSVNRHHCHTLLDQWHRDIQHGAGFFGLRASMADQLHRQSAHLSRRTPQDTRHAPPVGGHNECALSQAATDKLCRPAQAAHRTLACIPPSPSLWPSLRSQANPSDVPCAMAPRRGLYSQPTQPSQPVSAIRRSIRPNR